MMQQRGSIFLDYNRMEAWLLAQAEAVRSWNPTLIVGILRGGAFPATVLSQATDIPVAFMRFNRQTGESWWDSLAMEPQAGMRVLLCEDFAGSGVTLTRCLAWLQAKGCEVKVLTLVHDSLSRHTPDLAIDLRGYKVVLPWERYTLSEKNRSAYAKLSPEGLGFMPADRDLEQWAYDLDGVFLPDVPEHVYETDLDAALETRHAQSIHRHIPDVKHGSYIITGRILSDESMTRTWLEREGIEYVGLVLRDTDKFDAADSWRHKAEAILGLGVSHFVESCPRQAMAIAAACPHVRVMQWDIVTGQGHWITAFKHESR